MQGNGAEASYYQRFQKILVGLGKIRVDLMEGKQCILILPRLRITRHYLVERGWREGNMTFELRNCLVSAVY